MLMEGFFFFFFLVLLPIQTSDTPEAETPLWTEPPFPARIGRALEDVVVALLVCGICHCLFPYIHKKLLSLAGENLKNHDPVEPHPFTLMS